MAGRGDCGHNDGHMNALLPPALLSTIPAESGTFVLAVYLGALVAAFALRLERRAK